MEQVKIFQQDALGSTDKFQAEVNGWLKKVGGTVKITGRCQSVILADSELVTTLTIFYEAKQR